MSTSRSLLLALAAVAPLAAFAQITTPAQPRPGQRGQADPQLDGKLQILDQLEGIWQVELFMHPGTAGGAAETADYRGTSTDTWVLDHKFIQEAHVASINRNLGIDPLKPADPASPGAPGHKPERDPADLNPRNPDEPGRPGAGRPEMGSVAFSSLPGMAYFGYDQEKNKYTATWLDARSGQVAVHYGDWNPADKTITFSSSDPSNAANPTTPAGRSSEQYTVTLKIVSDHERTIETRRAAGAKGLEPGAKDQDILYRARYTKPGDGR